MHSNSRGNCSPAVPIARTGRHDERSPQLSAEETSSDAPRPVSPRLDLLPGRGEFELSSSTMWNTLEFWGITRVFECFHAQRPFLKENVFPTSAWTFMRKAARP